MFSLNNLSVGYSKGKEKNTLLENINLNFNDGQLICLLGGNGSGKSTLLKSLAGLHKPFSVDNQSQLTEFQKPEKISLVLTEKLNFANMTVLDLVTTGRYAHVNWLIQLSKEDKKAIEDALALVGITFLKQELTGELSDGQLQLAMIARALAQNTPYILLDEPTAHLDLNNRMEIMTLLRRLAHQHNKTILVSTHELDLALQLADELWLIQNKKIVCGMPEELVLNGVLDEAFPLKGFNLKTGEMHYEKTRNQSIQLIGEGYRYLWTKNALERMGYSVMSTDALFSIEVRKEDWMMLDYPYRNLSSLKEALFQFGK